MKKVANASSHFPNKIDSLAQKESLSFSKYDDCHVAFPIPSFYNVLIIK